METQRCSSGEAELRWAMRSVPAHRVSICAVMKTGYTKTPFLTKFLETVTYAPFCALFTAGSVSKADLETDDEALGYG